MNDRIRVLCLLIWGLLVVLLAATPARAHESRVRDVDAEEAASERDLIYDYKTGVFVHARRGGPPEYRIGNVKVDVGYDEQIVRTKDAWPESVNRFRYRHLFDQ